MVPGVARMPVAAAVPAAFLKKSLLEWYVFIVGSVGLRIIKWIYRE